MARRGDLKPNRVDSGYLTIDIFGGRGREMMNIDELFNKSTSPSLIPGFVNDERTQKLINASFLPFFALLSIPPSFN